MNILVQNTIIVLCCGSLITCLNRTEWTFRRPTTVFSSLRLLLVHIFIIGSPFTLNLSLRQNSSIWKSETTRAPNASNMVYVTYRIVLSLCPANVYSNEMYSCSQSIVDVYFHLGFNLNWMVVWKNICCICWNREHIIAFWQTIVLQCVKG